MGFEYDVAGNQTRALAADGVTWVKYEYDAANRLHVVKRASDDVYLQAFQYGSTNARLMDLDYGFVKLKLFASAGGVNGALWNQTYSYDRYGNRTNVTKSGVAVDGSPIPLDGIPNLAYYNTSNRITTAGLFGQRFKEIIACHLCVVLTKLTNSQKTSGPR